MSARIGLLCIFSLVFLNVSHETAAQSGAAAQIRATATVVVPLGIYDNSAERSSFDSDSTAFDICHPTHTGIIVTITDDKGILSQYRFPAKGSNKDSGEISGTDNGSVSIERAIFSRDDYSLQDSCLITIIYSEN